MPFTSGMNPGGRQGFYLRLCCDRFAIMARRFACSSNSILASLEIMWPMSRRPVLSGEAHYRCSSLTSVALGSLRSGFHIAGNPTMDAMTIMA